MQYKNQKRYYTPQFSLSAVVSVRRLAWALGVPMPKAVDLMVQSLPSIKDPSRVCLSCQDQSACSNCAFSKHSTVQEVTAKFAAL